MPGSVTSHRRPPQPSRSRRPAAALAWLRASRNSSGGLPEVTNAVVSGIAGLTTAFARKQACPVTTSSPSFSRPARLAVLVGLASSELSAPNRAFS